jgi:hypothetical protein
MHPRLTRTVGVLALVAGALLSPRTDAASTAPERWVHTGDAVLTSSFLLLELDVFVIRHDMKCRPEHKSGAEVVAADCDKRFTWKALRDVTKDEIRASLKAAYRSVDYGNARNVERALKAFRSGLREGAVVTIAYDAASKRTTFRPPGAHETTVEGADFMRATWSVLLANPDLADVGEGLIRYL